MMLYKISIFSYNSRGFSANSAIVCNILSSLYNDRIPIILNHENFILKGNSYKISEALPGSNIIFKLAEPPPPPHATIEQKAFTDLISNNLDKITVPQECNCINVHCRNIDHIEYINKYVLDILDTVEMASKEYLAERDNGKNGCKKTIPGYNEYIAPALGKAQFLFAVWESSGRPMNTALHNNMKRMSNWYHNQIRKIKHAKKDIISSKLLLAAAEDRIDFFQQLRNMH